MLGREEVDTSRSAERRFDAASNSAFQRNPDVITARSEKRAGGTAVAFKRNQLTSA